MHQINLQGPWLLSTADMPKPKRWKFPCLVSETAEDLQSGFCLSRNFHIPTGLDESQIVVLYFEFEWQPEKMELNQVPLDIAIDNSLELDVTEKLDRFNQITFCFPSFQVEGAKPESVLKQAKMIIRSRS